MNTALAADAEVCRVYSGMIRYEPDLGQNYDATYGIWVGDTQLTEAVLYDAKRYGHFARVAYFVSNKPLGNDVSAVRQAHLCSILGGALSVEYAPIMGTEWTGQYGLHETLTVGGHDLIRELRSYERCYVLLEIRYIGQLSQLPALKGAS